VIEATVDFKVFLGEYMDYQIKIGEHRVQARVHPSFKAAVGDTVYIRLNPEKCITIQDNTQYRKAA
jgi:iron(III) transport system ATP-binding protein